MQKAKWPSGESTPTSNQAVQGQTIPAKFTYYKGSENIEDPLNLNKQKIVKKNGGLSRSSFGFERANYELAVHNVNAKSNRFYKGQKVSFFINRKHFKVYGAGIYLFFDFLMNLSLLFLLLSIISLIPIIYNYLAGSYFNDAPPTLDIFISKVSISNFYGNNQNTQVTDQQVARSSKAKLLNGITDLTCCFIFMIFYFYWTRQSTKKTQQIKKSLKLASYYTLQLTSFPQSATDQDVYNFFSKFGTVTEVAPVKNYSQTIQLSKQIYQIQVDIKKLKIQQQTNKNNQHEQTIKQYQIKKQKLYQQLQEEQKKINGEVIKYYISFETTNQKTSILQKFKKFNKRCCMFLSHYPEEFLLNGEKIEVENCHVQPGEILWENVNITWKTRWIRAIIQFLLLLIFVAAGFFIISTLNILTPPSSSDSIDTSTYTQTSILSQSDLMIVQSWCLKHKDLAYSTIGLTNKCDIYIKRYYYNIAITYSITIIVIIVKILLKNLVIFIAKFQRYKQHTQQSIDIVKNLVIIYIMTTVIIGFLLQAELFGIKFKNVIFNFIHNSTLQKNAQKLKDYSQLTNKWYVDIGYKIWFTWLIMAFSPHFYMPIINYLMQCLKHKLSKSQLLQKDMQRVLQAEQFPIQDNYANIIMIFLVAFAFSGGMPIMLILSFIAIITRYAYYKHHFIRFCKVPNTIDQVLNDTVLSYFPWALGLHFVMTIWMYSVPTVFAHEKSFLQTWFSSSTSPIIMFLHEIIKRISASSYYSVASAAMMLIIMFKQIIYDFFVKIFKKQNEEQHIQFEQTVKQIFQNNIVITSQRSITNSYRIQNNPNYFQILCIKEKMAKRLEAMNNFMKDNFIEGEIKGL